MKIIFQPLIDLHRLSLLGFEALSRFSDGRGPELHFAQAHQEGRLLELEQLALQRTIEASIAIPAGLLLTVNASGPMIDALAQTHPALDPRLRWGLELNERSAPEQCNRARSSAEELNCLLLVDDAGIGFSTQDRILLLKPHIVKLDRSLFVNYQSSSEARIHVDSLLAAARATQAKTLVEGVETAEHLELAKELGFDYAQGFYFGRGDSAQELSTSMHKLHRRLGIDIPGF